MNSLSRATLAASHLAVAGLGVMAGFQMPADPSSVAGLEEPGSPAPSSSVEKSKPAHANPPHAEAWESLNDRSLPRSDRLAIQKTLLREWSRIDLEAALHAALTETPRDQDGLLAACSPGMLANPSQAWDLVMARSFGWETALARSMWIGLMMKNQPADYFSKLPEMPRSDRLRTLGSMAFEWREIEDASLKKEIWSKLQEQAATADRETFANIAQGLGDGIPLEYLLPELERGSTPADRRLAAAGIGIGLGSFKDEEFDREFARIPEALRAEVAASALAADDWGIAPTLRFAQLALEAGHLDDLAAASSREGFRLFSEETEDPAALLDWAFALPDDPRVTELYRQALRGADRVSFFNEAADGTSELVFDKLLARVELEPPGWKRDHGLAVLAPRGLHRKKTHDEVQSLLEAIGSPDLRAQATKECQDQLKKERQDEAELDAE